MSAKSYSRVLRKWLVTAGGTAFYILAANEPKAVEVAEAHLGLPPGSVPMGCASLPSCFEPINGGWLQ